MAGDGRHTQAETPCGSLAGLALKIKMKKKKKKATVFKIMELLGKNTLHDWLCGKYLFLSACERVYHA